MSSDDFQEKMSHGSDLSNIAGALQRHRQAKILIQQTSLLEEQNRLLRGQEAERQRLAALPKCPECMQPVEYESSVCSRCVVAVFWLDIVELENLDNSSSPKADIGLWLVSKPLLESSLTQNFQRLQTQSQQIKTGFQSHVRRGTEILEKLQGFQNDLRQSFSSLNEGRNACSATALLYTKLNSLEAANKSLKEKSVLACKKGFLLSPVLIVVFMLPGGMLAALFFWCFGIVDEWWRDALGAVFSIVLYLVCLRVVFRNVLKKRKDNKDALKELNNMIERSKKKVGHRFFDLHGEVHEMLEGWFRRQQEFEEMKNSFGTVVQSHSTLAMRMGSGNNVFSSDLQVENYVTNIDTKYSDDLMYKDTAWLRQTLEHLAENTGLKNLVPKAQPSQSKPADSRKGKMPHQYWIKRGEKIHGPFDAARVLDQSQKNKFKTGDRLGNFQDGPWALLSSEHLAKMQTGADVVIS